MQQDKKPTLDQVRFGLVISTSLLLCFVVAFGKLGSLQTLGMLKALLSGQGANAASAVNGDNVANADLAQDILALRAAQGMDDKAAILKQADGMCASQLSPIYCLWVKVQAYEQILALTPSDTTVRERLAATLATAHVSPTDSWQQYQVAKSNQRESDAALWLARAILIVPVSAQDWYSRGLANTEAAHPANAIVALDRARQMGYYSGDVYFALGKAHEQLKEIAAAAAAYKAAADATSFNEIGRSDALYAHAWLLIYEAAPSDDVQAAQLLEQAAAANSFNQLVRGLAAACFQLGHTYLRLGRPTQAVESYTRAVDLIPESSDYRVSLGAALVRVGKPAEGVAALKKALDIDANSLVALRVLADYYMSIGDLERARPYLLHMVRIDPNDTWAAEALAKIK